MILLNVLNYLSASYIVGVIKNMEEAETVEEDDSTNFSDGS